MLQASGQRFIFYCTFSVLYLQLNLTVLFWALIKQTELVSNPIWALIFGGLNMIKIIKPKVYEKVHQTCRSAKLFRFQVCLEKCLGSIPSGPRCILHIATSHGSKVASQELIRHKLPVSTSKDGCWTEKLGMGFNQERPIPLNIFKH